MGSVPNGRGRRGRGGTNNGSHSGIPIVADWHGQLSLDEQVSSRLRISNVPSALEQQAAIAYYASRNIPGISSAPAVPAMQQASITAQSQALGSPFDWPMRQAPQAPQLPQLPSLSSHMSPYSLLSGNAPQSPYSIPGSASFPPYSYGYPPFALPAPGTIPQGAHSFAYTERNLFQPSPLDMRIAAAAHHVYPPPPRAVGVIGQGRSAALGQDPNQHGNELERARDTESPEIIVDDSPPRGRNAEGIENYESITPPPDGQRGGAEDAQLGMPNHKKFQYKAWMKGLSTSQGNQYGFHRLDQQVEIEDRRIPCLDNDGLVRELRLSQYISEEHALQRVQMLGVEETQREIDSFEALISLGNQYRTKQRKLQEQRALAAQIAQQREARERERQAAAAAAAAAAVAAQARGQQEPGLGGMHAPLCDRMYPAHYRDGR